jgi:hypothetical protein
MRVFTIITILCICLLGHSYGQSVAVGSSAKEIAAYPVAQYKKATEISQNLYNGRQYYMYDSRGEEHQFFIERKWRKGVVRYDGQLFDSIAMMYDIVKDELVIKHFNGDHILLQSEKVDSFWLEQHDFQRLESGKDVNVQMRTGFYDILYDGKTRTIMRRTKQRQEKIVDKSVIALFPPKDFFYILKDGRYHSVYSKKSTIALFPEYKKELRRVLREPKIKFRKNREAAITRIAARYDELAKP